MEQKNNSTSPADMDTSQRIKDLDSIIDISGPGPGNRPKAHVVLRYYEQYIDGTTQDINYVTINKPILSVFKHPGYVSVRMDFGQSSDMDLRIAWNILDDYSRPMNSVSYLPEEIEEGYYMVNGVKKMVYFPMFEVILSPIGKEDAYEMRGVNPVFFTLRPQSPMNLDPCVLEFTFDEEFFTIIHGLEEFNLGKLRQEAIDELSQELGENPSIANS